MRLLLLLFLLIGCGDDYMSIERRVINSDTKIPMYFFATAEQAGTNTWRPVFTYYIYTVEEGEYDAYFHAYVIDSSNTVMWVGVQPIKIEGGKRIWGEYVTDAELFPHEIGNVLPMAYVSVEY